MHLSDRSRKHADASGGSRAEARRKWWERLQFTLLFLAVTLLLHALLVRFHGWLEPDDRYREPAGGRAFKVLSSGFGSDPDTAPGDRLRLFYWLGE